MIFTPSPLKIIVRQRIKLPPLTVNSSSEPPGFEIACSDQNRAKSELVE